MSVEMKQKKIIYLKDIVELELLVLMPYFTTIVTLIYFVASGSLHHFLFTYLFDHMFI